MKHSASLKISSSTDNLLKPRSLSSHDLILNQTDMYVRACVRAFHCVILCANTLKCVQQVFECCAVKLARNYTSHKDSRRNLSNSGGHRLLRNLIPALSPPIRRALFTKNNKGACYSD